MICFLTLALFCLIIIFFKVNLFFFECPIPGYIEEACIIPCPSDCKLSEWSNWSRCSKSCGSGVKVRSKWLREKPYNGGRPCPKLDHVNQVKGLLFPQMWTPHFFLQSLQTFSAVFLQALLIDAFTHVVRLQLLMLLKYVIKRKMRRKEGYSSTERFNSLRACLKDSYLTFKTKQLIILIWINIKY